MSIKHRNIFYATNPNNSNYRWLCRGHDDKYIMLHKNSVSKSILKSHSFFHEMEFELVTVQETIEWANHVIDSEKWISQQVYTERKQINSVLEKQSVGRQIREYVNPEFIDVITMSKNLEQYVKGDIVVLNTNLGEWIFQLNGIFDTNKYKLNRGIQTLPNAKLLDNIHHTQAFCHFKDITRHATNEEKEWFHECFASNYIKRVKPSNVSINPESNIIQFGNTKKETKKEENKIKFELSKIKTYEY